MNDPDINFDRYAKRRHGLVVAIALCATGCVLSLLALVGAL